MKKILAAFFAALLLMGSVPVSAAESGVFFQAAPTGVTINVYNWGEYISTGEDGSMNVNAEFTKETGIKVNYTTFEDNESLYSKMAGGGANYDVIFPSDYMVSKMIREKMLAKLDFSKHPQLQVYRQDIPRARSTTRRMNTPFRTPGA